MPGLKGKAVTLQAIISCHCFQRLCVYSGKQQSELPALRNGFLKRRQFRNPQSYQINTLQWASLTLCERKVLFNTVNVSRMLPIVNEKAVYSLIMRSKDMSRVCVKFIRSINDRSSSEGKPHYNTAFFPCYCRGAPLGHHWDLTSHPLHLSCTCLAKWE